MEAGIFFKEKMLLVDDRKNPIMGTGRKWCAQPFPENEKAGFIVAFFIE